MKRTPILLSLAIFLLLFFGKTALACSCSVPGTVLKAYDDADIVVATKLVAVEKGRRIMGTSETGEDLYIERIVSSTMVVTKVYKGAVKVGQELKFGQGGGGDCIWMFDEKGIGSEYLFYLGKPTKGHPFLPEPKNSNAEPMYHAIICGRSRHLKNAFEDLAYLDNIDQLRGKTRLYGTFEAYGRTDFPKEGIKIKVVSEKASYAVKTDSNGFFELYDLPPGDYDVSLESPFGWRLASYEYAKRSNGHFRVQIEKGNDSEFDKSFFIDTRIRGKVLSPIGEPMAGVCVNAIPIPLRKDGDDQAYGCTEKDGTFELTRMDPGNYVLVANADGRIDSTNPFGAVYFPGVDQIKNAGIVTVEAGKPIVGQTIQIPTTVPLVRIRGRVTYSDGKPVVGEFVEFEPDDAAKFGPERVKTDKDGRFTFHLPRGVTGKVAAEMFLFDDDYKNCKEIFDLITRDNSIAHKIASSAVRVSTVSPPPSVTLVFPFAYCKPSDK